MKIIVKRGPAIYETYWMSFRPVLFLPPTSKRYFPLLLLRRWRSLGEYEIHFWVHVSEQNVVK